MTSQLHSATPRWRRLAAGCVLAAPLLSPLAMLIGLAASGEARGMGGASAAIILYGWSGLAAGATLLWLMVDLVRLAQKKPTLAFAYAGLVVAGARPLRQLLAALLVVVLPIPLGWSASAFCAASATCGLDLENDLLWCTPMAFWAANWLFWLGPSARTLGDRVAGGRAVTEPTHASQLSRRRPWWPQALLLAPPLLGLPISGGWGGSSGLLLALAILCIPVWVTRRPVAG